MCVCVSLGRCDVVQSQICAIFPFREPGIGYELDSVLICVPIGIGHAAVLFCAHVSSPRILFLGSFVVYKNLGVFLLDITVYIKVSAVSLFLLHLIRSSVDLLGSTSLHLV